MSTLNRAGHSHAADGPAAARGVDRHDIGVGVYLTDEAFLYRVVALVENEAGQSVELEDCYSLDIVRVPAGDVRARRLRVVSPTA